MSARSKALTVHIAETPPQSRECQAAHWKTHKPQCKLHLQNDQIYRDMEEKYPDLYPNAVDVARKLSDWQKVTLFLYLSFSLV